LGCGCYAHDGCADDQSGDVLRDGADDCADDAQRGAPNEDPAAAEDVGDASNDGQGYGGGECVTKGYPYYVWVLGCVSVGLMDLEIKGKGLTGPISALIIPKIGAA
jgi:hypothetical protein